ncbi:centrosome-associated zinc finger protein CP190 [Eupeodes corollae]|uniref:centrosome-associated zinc finger protein CP190 n=1 Tax=Eupeodes corollae TaxID=290404 RepID=UPI0024924528|nr:centrosome-associated zinc finger protein CP190 [Eupeodes corollae]XP_055903297.1 centrosome-associated zinc finger protein CP190 [Eupeodes corollae]
MSIELIGVQSYAMGEIKSVKVDNWGVFFLQKLQNFFNKTDFCDLTLQFRDNSQLKVHRLVLSACTDFFNVLEQTCELMDDALVMPAELQADVVVPIVNFMYTGTLEFELKMYGKLLKTAKEMNMTVLLKLLEAHKRTMEISRTAPSKVANQMIKKKSIPINAAPKLLQSPQSSVNSTQQPQQRLQHTTIHTNTTPKRGIMRQMQDRITYKPAPNTLLRVPPKLQRGPIRFEEPNSQAETYESSFDSISYESKPLKEEPEDYIDMQSSSQWNRSSPFEQLRKGFNNNKRPAVATFTSPPAKKPNIEDVKEFSEQQRMRKQIAAEFGDDAEFDSIMDDEFHHDDDDEEPLSVNPSPSSSSVLVKQQQQQQQQLQQQNQHSSIIIKQSPNEKPTIVVKDSSNSKMDHAKIISEVLRQYPHLVKSNKNIKLKIMPNIGGQSQKIIVKKEAIENISSGLEQSNETEKLQTLQQPSGSQKAQTIIKKPLRAYPSAVKVETQTKAAQIIPAKNSNDVKTAPSAAPQKRRIDSKTMHALIAQGAENTTGPWLCLRCGVNGRPISIPSYRGFRRHLINTHKETIDAALCEYCGWRSKTNRELHHHMLTDHKVASLLYTFPECKECNKICLSENDLQLHGEQYHPDSHKQQCIYCNKVFVKEMNLYTHMKTFHKKRAREDGVIDFSDEEMDEELEANSSDAKIKILSDIALPSTLLNLEEHQPTVEEEEYANDSGPKFVNADGNEMLLTAEQREEIMSQLDQDHDGGVVMVLNESVFPPDEGTEVAENDIKLKVEARDAERDTDEFVDPNTEFLSTADAAEEEEANKVDEDERLQEHHESDNDERLDDEDHMEWAENLISAHDADDDEQMEDDKNNDDIETDDDEGTEKDVNEENKIKEEIISPTKSAKDEKPDPKKAEDINLKLKMLTGDWTDDEIDEEEEENIAEQLEQHKEKTQEHEESVIPPVEDEAEKVKSDNVENKSQDEATDEFINETEVEADSSLIAEDEITQSSHSEQVQEEDEATKEEVQVEKSETTAEEKSEDVISEPESAAPTDVEKNKEVVVSSVEGGRTSRRTSSAKEKDLQKSQSTDDLSDSKTQSTKKDNDDVQDEETETETDKPPKSKTPDEDKDGVKTLSKSIEEDSSKTPDKVKSLLNEWADEEDDL